MSHDARTSPVLRIRAECKASDEDEAPLTPGQRARQILAGARNAVEATDMIDRTEEVRRRASTMKRRTSLLELQQTLAQVRSTHEEVQRGFSDFKDQVGSLETKLGSAERRLTMTKEVISALRGGEAASWAGTRLTFAEGGADLNRWRRIKNRVMLQKEVAKTQTLLGRLRATATARTSPKGAVRALGHVAESKLGDEHKGEH